MTEIIVQTSSRSQLIDITKELKRLIRKNEWKDGLLAVWTPHTTAAITVNENADPDVPADITSFLNNKIPKNWGFSHMEGNSDAHIKSSLVGCSETIMVEDGKMLLGTWQGIFFCEFDGPRNRKVWVKFISNISM
ncbi:secondary thiamine-phosphate synthase enzyme YjbQ [Limisalsivibrio acetivorans]|uniref:secondary thiamine-phosphate synthase enzyme YjbQ n=1 Tax=Limisalsivibrio acetivorans TaxID=1304888 RepID=UPI0003B59D25|nr:secondary thiamine-phosphate synthase enzyme YjbQ [Limisalsivibrio acetivorans]